MDPPKQLSAALAELQRIQMSLAALSGGGGDAWKQDLIDLRRQLAAQIGLVGQLAEGCEGLRRSEAQGRSFWDLLAKMRTTVALHQARWPAVAIRQDDPAYQQSISAVRTANRAFVAMAQEIIPNLAR